MSDASGQVSRKIYPPKPRTIRKPARADICTCTSCGLRFINTDTFDLHLNLARGACEGPFPYPREMFVQLAHGIWKISKAA
jgi:hypothetical protein